MRMQCPARHARCHRPVAFESTQRGARGSADGLRAGGFGAEGVGGDRVL